MNIKAKNEYMGQKSWCGLFSRTPGFIPWLFRPGKSEV